MHDDREFCRRDLAATSPVLRPVGSGRGFVCYPLHQFIRSRTLFGRFDL